MPQSGGTVGGIEVYSANPRYWQYRGRPVLLLGGSVEDNLFQIDGLETHLDALTEAGGNYVRCTMSSRDEGNLWPFERVDGGYDLEQPNRLYWLRFATFLEETRRRGIIVQVEVWATFDFYRDNWDRNPFNPRNNVNYGAAESGLSTVVDSHPVKAENGFFRTVLAQGNTSVVLHHQEQFVDEVLATSLVHPHVLYCIDNETSVTPAWGAYWAGYIKRTAQTAGRTVHVTEMWDPHDLDHPMHANTLDHPETYDFADISQNNHQSGQQHYDRAFAAWRRVAESPRPLNNVKIYGADGGRFGTSRDGIERFWRNIFAGHASARFHRPGSGIGLGPPARRMLCSAREVTDELDVFCCEPRPDLLSDRSENEAYCLAEEGRQYAVYFPDGGAASLRLNGANGRFRLRWYDAERSEWAVESSAGGGAPLHLNAPGDGHQLAVLQRE